MGAWGVRVLENDSALDDMHCAINEHKFSSISEFVRSLLGEQDYKAGLHALLGIAIVDASINGVDYTLFSSKESMYGYKDWFHSLSPDPLICLLPLAQEAIVKCIEAGVDAWNKECQKDRMALYTTFKNRLNKEKNNE